jgi:putative nucleotidyltransferase with HDIG domain
MAGLSVMLERLRARLGGRRGRAMLVLVVVAVSCALLTVEYSDVPQRSWMVGETVDRDIRAPSNFEYVDGVETTLRREAAADKVLPVYDLNADAELAVRKRLSAAFDLARRGYADALLKAQAEGEETVSAEELSRISREFLAQLQLSLDAEDMALLAELRWSRKVEEAAQGMIEMAMRSYIVADRSVLPHGVDSIRIVRLLRDQQDEFVYDDLDQLITPADARQKVSLYALEKGSMGDPTTRAAVALARAGVLPNLSPNPRDTAERRERARQGVGEVVQSVTRGAMLAREGEVLTPTQVDQLQAMQHGRAGPGQVGMILALVAFCGLVLATVHQFVQNAFARRLGSARELEAVGVLMLLALILGRITVELSLPLSEAVGLGATPQSFWLLVPVAGGAMLVRILVNAEAALVWTLLTACMLGMMMEQQVLFTLFFTISGVTAAGAVAANQERLGVLRAGMVTGLVNAATALIMQLVTVYLGDNAAGEGPAGLPLWDVGFSFVGGALSGVLVLGLVPIFELFGFVTDYRLLELANLNHPLLRQLMLRAPGTYHHSVTVAQLSEAAAEAIGANALHVRVSCYFHDIGKAVNPKYFIENQRGGPNPHDRLPPRTSARVIINHVTDGEAIAKQYKLPKPILDGITMHHGTGLIQYFYVKAQEAAGPDDEVLESDYRYPGSLPDTREAGIMMLADKCEAATRTLKDKSPNSLRGLIQKLVNSTLMDGQLEKCPLTVKELYTIVESFTETLQGIYHHRIEYPGVPKRKPPVPEGDRPTGPVITLEITNPFAEKAAKEDAAAASRAESAPEPAAASADEEPSSGPIAPLPVSPPAAPPAGRVPDEHTLRRQPSFSPDDDYESAAHLPHPSDPWRGKS